MSLDDGKSSPKIALRLNSNSSSSSPRSSSQPPRMQQSPSNKKENGHPHSYLSPSPSELLAKLPEKFFDTSPETFDAKFEALSGFGSSLDTNSLAEGLLTRVEEVDLARDVVSLELANEVRRSSSGLIAGMRQVQDLDLDVARTTLHVTAVRRRLALTKKELFQAELNVAKLSERKSNLVSIQNNIQILVRLSKLKKECDSTIQPLSASIQSVIDTLEIISKEFPIELSAVGFVKNQLKKKISNLEAKTKELLKNSIIGPKLDKYVYTDVLICLKLLQKNENEIFAFVKDVWINYIESIMEIPKDQKQEQQQRAFIRLSNACESFHQILLDSSLTKEELMVTKRESLAHVTKIAEEYMKSPLIRSQVLDDFACTISDAADLTESLDSWFGEDGDSNGDGSQAHYFNKTKMESTIRLRARIYAQQYQAEGFQAMRGLLLRETWIDVNESSTNSDFAVEIFKRLEIPTDQVKKFVFTAATASGIPRQVQRTMDLMKKLPASASYEACSGLLRIIDLYLYAMITVFVPKSRFFESKSASKTICFQYMVDVRESLTEWLTSAAGEFTANEDIVICEFDFLHNPRVSYKPALVASQSLEFIGILLKGLEKRLTELLPSVERAKLASKMFVELPTVVDQLQTIVRGGAIEKLLTPIQFSDLQDVYDDADGITQDFNCFKSLLQIMSVIFHEISTHKLHPIVWDEACSLFFEKYLNGIAKVTKCSPIDRGNMAVHLASFWEKLSEISTKTYPLGPSAMKSKSKVDDFIKAFYINETKDFWDWMKKTKDDYEPAQYTAIFETGLLGQRLSANTSYLPNGNRSVVGGKREAKQEFDRLISSFYG